MMGLLKIDQENPVCLYCQNNCYIESTSTNFILTNNYSCHSCDESFLIKHLYSSELILVTEFTCYDYTVSYTVTSNTLWCRKLLEDFIKIPIFIPDFSDKEKLHRKIIMCVVFA